MTVQVPGYFDYLRAAPRGCLPRSLSGVGRLNAAPANPYPGGVPVAGTGSSKPWPTAYMPSLGVWVANTGFGIAPIFTQAQFSSLFEVVRNAPALKGTNAREFFGIASRLTFYDADTGMGLDPSIAVDMGVQGTDPSYALSGVVELYAYPTPLTINTADGGRQIVSYDIDAAGYWRPVSAQGFGRSTLSIFDELIKIGAIVGATIATAGTAGGFATGAGPGAEAIGGSAAAADVGAGAAIAPAAAVAPAVTDVPAATVVPDVASTTAPEIATFAPPAIAPPAVVDVSASVPIDITSATSAAATAATNPLSQVFSISKYIQTLAGAYKTVAGLSSPGSHPQTGTVTRLPDGSTQRVNPDGSTTIVEPSGNQTTVGAGGQVSTSYPSTAGAGLLLAAAAAALALFTS